MIISDLHTHTTYCDGKNTPEEMLSAAIEKGLKIYGFSSHAHLKYDESWNMSFAAQQKYVDEICALRQKYNGKIEVLLGIEYDLYSDSDITPFDYVIGSCHTVIKDGAYISVDESEAVYTECVNRFYGGDSYALVKDYYSLISNACDMVDCTFFGHFDLVNKFNRNFKFFDENDRRYTEPMYAALEKLAKTKKPFELNTAATYRHNPDLATASAVKWLSALSEMGGNIIINSDAHRAEDIGKGFAKAEALAKQCGFKRILTLTSHGFEEIYLN